MHYSDLNKEVLIKDAPFAWFLFDQAKLNPRYRYPDFQRQSEMLEAHLDALAMALEAGHPIENWLDMGDWGSCFQLAALGIRYRRNDLFLQALDALQEGEESHYQEIVDACLWHEQDEGDDWLLALQAHHSPVAQQAFIAILRTNRHPSPPSITDVFFEHPHPAVKKQLLNWIGEQKQTEQLSYVQQFYLNGTQLKQKPQDLTLAFAATRAGILLKDPDAKNQLKHFALTQNPFMLEALGLLFINEEDIGLVRQWIKKIWEMEKLPVRAKFYATAVSGLIEFTENLFDYMADSIASKAAGEAFTLLIGVDIEDNNLDDKSIQTADINDHSEDAELNQTDKNTSFINDWEEDQPYPDTDACYMWWEKNQSQFNKEERHLAGLITNEENLLTILKKGNQRQRHLASLHLSLRLNYNWRDPSWPI
ncbi:MAG: hypothetical protein ACRBBR_14180 [Cellvibrionaceae bacterium]